MGIVPVLAVQGLGYVVGGLLVTGWMPRAEPTAVPDPIAQPVAA